MRFKKKARNKISLYKVVVSTSASNAVCAEKSCRVVGTYSCSVGRHRVRVRLLFIVHQMFYFHNLKIGELFSYYYKKELAEYLMHLLSLRNLSVYFLSFVSYRRGLKSVTICLKLRYDITVKDWPSPHST